MANADAWQAGVDIATGGKGKKKDTGDTPQKAGADDASKPMGGLLGLAGKGMRKLARRGKGPQTPAGGAPATATNSLAVAAGLPANTPVFKKGGRVRKTGLALVHKGEYVIPAQKGHSRRKAAGKRTTIKA